MNTDEIDFLKPNIREYDDFINVDIENEIATDTAIQSLYAFAKANNLIFNSIRFENGKYHCLLLRHHIKSY